MARNNYKEDEKLEEKLNIEIITRLLSYLKDYKLEVIKTLMFMGVVIAAELLNPYFLKIGIDHYILKKDIKGLFLLGGLIVLANLIAMFCSRKRIMIMSRVSNKILLTIRQNLYTHIQSLSFSFFDNRPVGKILARIIGDVNSLNELFTNSVTNLIPDLIKIITVVVIMMSMNFKLALISLTTLPFLLITMFIVQIVSRRRWQIFRKKNSNMNAYTHEDFSGIRVVQSFTLEEHTSNVFYKLLSDVKNSFVDAVKMNDLFWPLTEISWGIGSVIVFWFGVNMLNTGDITVGLLVAFTGYISIFWQPIVNISNFYNTLITNMAGAERIFEILDIQPEIKDSKNAYPLPKIKGNVTFKNVSFSYDEEKLILNNINFHVNAGETIALVGPTGAGKTTIVNLISRFYENQKGKILIDGHDINSVTIESLRSQMGIMTQDTFMFSGTIKDNIRYGKLDATDEEIVKAAKAVCAHDFIIKLEKGYDTNVNERGSRLSVGQRQLIAFARTLLADPRILILDEATSSIDTKTERLIQKGIEKLLYGRTAFVIAHRLSTIQNADRIMVIDDGEIKEMGNHEELIKQRGLYYELFNAQFKFIKEHN
ncbi:ABC transporter ATP-binding protein [Defluviitalea phaphyphila]|uniref:ABC transporter ATP-binding protein n=1 Tax=Defluviitalea phaphyphila TaxID=1473580 RepID=UPI0007309BC9|nr:ABC transporter ATP-binding protein [Defluviitalea phaphyphila]